ESAVELRAAPGAPSATRQGRCDHAVGGCVTVLVEELRDSAQCDGVEKFVVGAVIHQDGSALVVTRSELDDFLPGIDELPSGGVEVGESLTAALDDRELLEEVGFESEVIDGDFL